MHLKLGGWFPSQSSIKPCIEHLAGNPAAHSSLVSRFMRPLTRRQAGEERATIRAICAILDAFHFGPLADATTAAPAAGEVQQEAEHAQQQLAAHAPAEANPPAGAHAADATHVAVDVGVQLTQSWHQCSAAWLAGMHAVSTQHAA